MRIKIMTPKSRDGHPRATATKTAASKLHSATQHYPGCVNWRPHSSKVLPSSLGVTIKTIESEKHPNVNTNSQLILHERNAKKINPCLSDHDVPEQRDTKKNFESLGVATITNKCDGALKENVTQQPYVECRVLKVESMGCVSSPPRQVHDPLSGCLSASATLSEMAKNSKTSSIIFPEKPSFAPVPVKDSQTYTYTIPTHVFPHKYEASKSSNGSREMFVGSMDDDVSDSVTQIKKNKSGHLQVIKDEPVDLIFPSQSDVIVIDSENDDVATNSLLLEESKSNPQYTTASNNNIAQKDKVLTSDYNKQLDVICLDSEDDDVVCTSVPYAKDTESVKIKVEKLLDIEVEDIDSNSLPPVYFSEKDVQNAKDIKLNFTDILIQERKESRGLKSKSLVSVNTLKRKLEDEKKEVLKQDISKKQDPIFKDTQSNRLLNDDTKTSRSNVHLQSKKVLTENFKDSQVQNSAERLHHKKLEKRKIYKSKKMNGTCQNSEINNFVIGSNYEQPQNAESVVSLSNELPNESSVNSEVSTSQYKSPSTAAYPIKKYERDKSCNLNSNLLNQLVNDRSTLDYSPENASHYEMTNKNSCVTHIKHNVAAVNELDEVDIKLTLQARVVLHDVAVSEVLFKKNIFEQNLMEKTNVAPKRNNVDSVVYDGTSSCLQREIEIGRSAEHKRNGQSSVLQSEVKANLDSITLVDCSNIQVEKFQDSSLNCNKAVEFGSSLPISTNICTPVVSIVDKVQSGLSICTDALLVDKSKNVGVSEYNLAEQSNLTCEELNVNSEIDKPQQHLLVPKTNISKDCNVNSNNVDLDSCLISADVPRHRKGTTVTVFGSYPFTKCDTVCQEQESDMNPSVEYSSEHEFQETDNMLSNLIQLPDISRSLESSTITMNTLRVNSQSKVEKKNPKKHKIIKKRYVPRYSLDSDKNKHNPKIVEKSIYQGVQKIEILKPNLTQISEWTRQAPPVDKSDSKRPLPLVVPVNEEIHRYSPSLRIISEGDSDFITTNTDLHNNKNLKKLTPTINDNLNFITNESNTLEGSHNKGSCSVLHQPKLNHEIPSIVIHRDASAEPAGADGAKFSEILVRLKTVQDIVQRLTEAQKNSDRIQIEIMKELQVIKNQNKVHEIRENWLVENGISLPMESMDEYRRFCSLLEQTPECKRILENYIHYAVNVKQTLTKNIASVMRKYFAPELASQFTAVKPKKHKFVLAETSFYSYLFGMFLQKSLTGVHTKRLSESDFNKALAEVLSGFKDHRSRQVQQTD